jgi:predicted helicase
MTVDEGGGELSSLKDYVTLNVDAILRHFGGVYFRSDDENKIQAITKMIVSQRAFNRLSIFGLIHCLNLIVTGDDGFDKELYGFDALALTRLFKSYLKKCKEKYQEFVFANQEKVGNREKWARIAADMPPNVREKVNNLQRKLEAKNGGANRDDWRKRLQENIAKDLKQGL